VFQPHLLGDARLFVAELGFGLGDVGDAAVTLQRLL
jgi:hypothetical protein